jgi:membrane fusion protein, multidrug efflux system
LLKTENASRQQRDTQASQVQQLKSLVQADEAAIESVRLQLEYASIRAPISGRASFANVTVGNIVHATDTASIVSVVQVQPISVVFAEPEQDLPAINRAFSAGPVEVTALTSDGKQTLAHGSLSVLNNQIDAASGTIQLKATFENKDSALWPGLSVTTRLLVRTLDRALVVPDKAVERGPDGFYVYVIDPQNKAMRHNIKIGPMANGQAVVEAGISAGDRVVTEGQYRLNNGVVVAANNQTPETTGAATPIESSRRPAAASEDHQ